MKALFGSLVALSSVALGGCDSSEKVEGPTMAQNELLNETEAMLDNLASNEERPANAEAPTGPKHRADESSGQ